MSSDEQLSEYQSQLSDIESLLADSPNDDSLLKLKSDLLELIELTKEQVSQQSTDENILGEDHIDGAADLEQSAADESTNGGVGSESKPQIIENDALVQQHVQPTSISSAVSTEIATDNDTNNKTDAKESKATNSKMSIKKSKKILSKPFEIPSHLIPLDSDTDAERKKKKRAARALKSQYKATQKTVESEVKQQSWQDFNKNKKKRKGDGGSIFKTEDGIGARTGVITGSVSVMGKERTSGKDLNLAKKKQRHLF